MDQDGYQCARRGDPARHHRSCCWCPHSCSKLRWFWMLLRTWTGLQRSSKAMVVQQYQFSALWWPSALDGWLLWALVLCWEHSLHGHQILFVRSWLWCSGRFLDSCGIVRGALWIRPRRLFRIWHSWSHPHGSSWGLEVRSSLRR